MSIKNIINELVVSAYKLKGGYVNVPVRDQSILISVDHLRTLNRAKTYSIKEPDTLDWLDSFESDSCYFDIGANIGQYSLYPAKKYGHKVQIYAFEPQSNNYYALNKNIYLNNLSEEISSYCVAVSGKTEFSKLYIPKFIPGGNRSQFGAEDLENMKISATHTQGMFGVTLDDLCGQWGFPYPNYMKIDVDGLELAILKGAPVVLKNPALKSVIIELGTEAERNEAIALMQQAGLEVKLRPSRNWGEAYLILKDPDRVVISQSVTFSVDVVIPVYNSPVLTKRCIDSVLTHLKDSIQQIYIQDDASHVETRTLLDEWVDAKIHVHHAEKIKAMADLSTTPLLVVKLIWYWFLILILKSEKIFCLSYVRRYRKMTNLQLSAQFMMLFSS